MKEFSTQIEVLEKQLIGNKKLADLVLAEIKTVFVSAILKLQTTPELQTPIEQKMLSLQTREFNIPTTCNATGPNYAHPSNPTYDNPIVAVHQNSASADFLLKFETKDGVVGVHPPNNYNFAKVSINPSDALVKRICVYTHGDSYIVAI